MTEKISKNLIPISIVIAGLLIAGVFVYVNRGLSSGGLGMQDAGEKAVNYLNENKDTLTGGLVVSLVSVSEEGSIYKVSIKVGDGEYDSYVSKDGKFLFPYGYNLQEASEGGGAAANNTTTEMEKRDKPDVKLFIMSYCPYGLQAQKMFLPAYELLKDKATMGVYFVNYIMHEKQEIDENLNQYCIQKEQKEKFSNYLNCFVLSGDSEKCLFQANIDKTKLSSCISQTDAEYKIYSQYDDKSTWLNGSFPKFDVQADLNTQYGVQGSPTIIINDQVVDVSPRSPERFKEIVCQAFNSQPSECSETLSGEAASTGIGVGTSSTSEGGCQ